MGRTAQEKAKIEHRRMQVSDLYLKDWTQVAIAQKLGVSQATVSGDIKAIRKEWKKRRVDNLETMVLEFQNKFKQILKEAWFGWEQSTQPLETTKVTQKNGEKNFEKTSRKQAGDPRYLKIALETANKLAELEGLDKSKTELDAAAAQNQGRLDWESLCAEAQEAANRTIEMDIEEYIAALGKAD